MTKLGEELIFSPECINKFFRLPIASDGVDFFVNTAKNSVSRFQARDRKMLQTWTLKHPHSFTAPLAFCTTDNTICCVMDNTTLITWTHSSENLEKASKIELHHPVFMVIPIEHICAIVFKNGDVKSLSDIESTDSSEQPQSSLRKGEEIIWADAVKHDGNVLVATIIKKRRGKSHTLVSFIMKDDSFSKLKSQRLKRNGLQLLHSCLRIDTTTVLTLWSDGELHAHDLYGGKSKMLVSIPGIRLDFAVQIDAIDKSHIAVAKIAFKLKKEVSCLEIWDLNYCVMKGSKMLKRHFEKNVRMKAFGTSLFFSLSGGVVMMSLALEASTLSSVVGISSSPREAKAYVWNDEGMSTLQDSTGGLSVDDDVFPDLASKTFFDGLEQNTDDDFHRLCGKISCRPDVTEDELVGGLKSCLRRLPEVQNDDKGNARVKMLLNALFKVSFTDVYMSQSLKRFNFRDTLAALQFLLNILTSHLFCGEQEQTPSDLQIVKWAEVLLNSHFDEFVVSNDKEVLWLLRKLRYTFAEKMDIYTELEEIKNFLTLIKKQTLLPEKATHSKYCIETLCL